MKWFCIFLLSTSACFVPSLEEVETTPRSCTEADAGEVHECPPGYFCLAGACELDCPALKNGPHFEEVEVSCDGFDNDCDGVVDGFKSGEPLWGSDCELSVGVCEGNRHACVNQAFEPVCRSSAYGPTWEPLETRCDGLDNDCDGRTDISGEFPIVQTTGPTHKLVWLTVGTSFNAVYVDEREGLSRLFFQRFGSDFKPLGAEIQLSSSTAEADYPAMLRWSTDNMVMWAEKSAGVWSLFLSRVDDTGRHVFGSPIRVANAVSFKGAPRLAVSHLETPGDGRILTLWVDAVSETIKGVVTRDDGTNRQPQMVLQTTPADGGTLFPDGGAIEHIIEADAVGTGDNDWAVGWVKSGGAPYGVGFKLFGTTFGAKAEPHVTAAAGQPSGLRMAFNSSTSAVWFESTISQPTQVRAMLNSLDFASSPITLASTSEPVVGLETALSGTDMIAAWRQGAAQSIKLVNLAAPTLLVDVALPAGAAGTLSSLSVTATSSPKSMALGYVVDRGGTVDVYGQLVCRP